MRFAFFAPDGVPEWFRRFEAGLAEVMTAHGDVRVDLSDADVQLVVQFVDRERPKAFRRRTRATFVVGVVEEPSATGRSEAVHAGYATLVRSISNALLLGPWQGPGTAFMLTPELGCYAVSADAATPEWGRIYDYLSPLASSHLIIDNHFVHDLPETLWQGTDRTRELSWASQEVAGWGVLPAPFPIRDLLSDQDWRHLQHLYSIGGLSWGNFSTRHEADTFWMSASGVDKSNLREIGRDIMLVEGYDAAMDAMVLHVPDPVQPRRVSVDAVEHSLVYRHFPQVGAVLHVHAWVPGIPCTSFNYPCGSLEAGQELCRVLEGEQDPGHAVVGMRHHGITVTGSDFHEIIERVAPVIQTTVPMEEGDAW